MSLNLFSIGIVGHITRQHRAERLGEAIGAEVVCIDTGGLGPGANHEVCYDWLAGSDSQWSVLLEDDALPVKDFRHQLGLVLNAAPTDLLSLYLGRSRPPHWQPSIARVIGGDHHFLVGPEMLHHVAVAIRTPMIPALLHHIRTDNDYRLGRLPIDEAVGRFARSIGVGVSHTHPSIVNHDISLPTTITRHASQHPTDDGERPASQARQAWAFGSRPAWDRIMATIPSPA